MYREMKEEPTSQKKTIHSQIKKKKNVPAKEKKPSLFCFTNFEQAFVVWVISFIFSFLD